MDIFSLLSSSEVKRDVSHSPPPEKLHPLLSFMPEELGRYYTRMLTLLYSRTSPGDFLVDALVNFAIQESSFSNWSWHSANRERVVVQIGGLNGSEVLSAALGNPRQAIVACPWPGQAPGAQLAKWCGGSLVQEICPSATISFAHAAALAKELSIPFIGTLIVRDPEQAPDLLGALNPLLERCDASTDIVVCASQESANILDVIAPLVYKSVDPSKIRKISRNSPIRSFALSRGEHRESAVKFADQSKEEFLPKVARWSNCNQDALFQAAPQSVMPLKAPIFVGGHGLQAELEAKKFEYMQAGAVTSTAANYYVLHDATVNQAGNVFKRDGITVCSASPPYQRLPEQTRKAEFEAEKLPGVWLLFSPAGMSHTHFLVDGLLRMWVAQEIPELMGVIAPRSFAPYQREMLQAALGKIQIVELDKLGRAVSVDKLVAWRFEPGQSVRVNSLLDRMRSTVKPDLEPYIFVRRSDRPLYRNCLNEHEVLELAMDLGYKIVDPGAMSGPVEIRTFSSAKVVVGALGAGIHNSIFCRSGASLITFTSKSYSEPHPFDIAALRGLDLTLLFCEQIDSPDTDPSCENRLSSFFVDVAKLGKLMEETRRRQS